MLANGITLGYKKKGSVSSSFTNLPGLKEVPEHGEEPEKVDVTCLSDSHKRYEPGIGDCSELEYVFNYENSSETSPYRILRKAQEEREMLTFEEALPDGTKYTFDAYVSVKRGGGGVNAALEFTATLTVDSMEITDPS